MIQYDLVIIGGGAAGLSAGIAALKNGIKKVLILDRNIDLGGNLNLFINNGFGEYYLGEKITGPELASTLISDYRNLNGRFKVNTEVLKVSNDRVVRYVNPEEGIQEVKATSIILSTGCREKFTGNIDIPIHKYIGILTLFSTLKLINIHGYLPGKNVVIVGENKIASILARRLMIEGANKVTFLDISSEGISKDNKEIFEEFNVKIIRCKKIIEIYGKERIESLDIISFDNNEIENVSCDSLILKVGYYPELGTLKQSIIEKDENGFLKINDKFETSSPGIFACGSLTIGEELIFDSGEQGYKAGKIVAEYMKNYILKSN